MNMHAPNKTSDRTDGWAVFTIALATALTASLGCRSELITDEDKTEAIIANSAQSGSPQGDGKGKESSDSGNPTPKRRFSGDAFRGAAHDGEIDIVREALDSGIDIASTDSQGHNALHMAAYNGHGDIVKLLLKNGAEVDERDGEGKSALIHASSGPFADTVGILIDAGANVDLADRREGFTALMTAASLGQKEVVAVLLKHGAKKELVDVDGDTAKDFAMQRGHGDIVKMLEP